MSAFAVRIASVAISFGAQTVLALADSPPKLNVAPSCDAAARGAIVAGRDREACMGDERAAQDILTKGWDKFAPADKTQCVGMNEKGGAASYVELLACLEIMRDAKSIRDSDPLYGSDTPASPATRRANARPRKRPEPSR
jgi:hypothetical protein